MNAFVEGELVPDGYQYVFLPTSTSRTALFKQQHRDTSTPAPRHQPRRLPTSAKYIDTPALIM
jgi:hypothetical protein